MTVSYESAMLTLQKMFPTAEPGVVTMVLEVNQGHMERTVEQLLAMDLPQADEEQVKRVEKIERAAATAAASGTKFEPDARPSSLVPEERLADDFLRPPSYFKHMSENQSQQDEDAILAQMLQDQEFMRELHANPEAFGFRRRRRHRSRDPQGEEQQQQQQQQQAGAGSAVPVAAAAASGAGAAGSAAAAAAAAPGADAEERKEDATMKDRWNALGAAAKRKFAALASKFGRKRGSDQSNYMALPALDDGMAPAEAGDDHPQLESDLGDFVIGDEDDEEQDDDEEEEVDDEGIRLTDRRDN